MKYKNEQDLRYFFKAEDKIKWFHSESVIFFNHTVIILETNTHLNTLNSFQSDFSFAFWFKQLLKILSMIHQWYIFCSISYQTAELLLSLICSGLGNHSGMGRNTLRALLSGHSNQPQNLNPWQTKHVSIQIKHRKRLGRSWVLSQTFSTKQRQLCTTIATHILLAIKTQHLERIILIFNMLVLRGLMRVEKIKSPPRMSKSFRKLSCKKIVFSLLHLQLNRDNKIKYTHRELSSVGIYPAL